MPSLDAEPYLKHIDFNSIENYIWVKINDYIFYFEDSVPIIQGFLQKGIYLPRFCYHSKLSLAGNCRLCFVEDLETVKPIVSCCVLINDELELFSHTQIIFNAREGVMEMLLINHPLDRPVCDQGGECDLQDQFMVFGNIVSRYYEKFKKNISDKDISNFIKLSLNKCINCTRCVRFEYEITGSYNFSLLGRGEYLETSNYIKNFYFFHLFQVMLLIYVLLEL